MHSPRPDRSTRYDPALRRKFGYLVVVGARSPLVSLLERAGMRPRPLNRTEPVRGHWVSDCVICGAEDGLFVEPGMSSWTTSCVRGEFTIFELHTILILGTAA